MIDTIFLNFPNKPQEVNEAQIVADFLKEGKTIVVNNMIARQFKQYIERKLQNGNPIVTVCVLEGRDYFTIVKPKNVDLRTVLKMD